MTMNTTNQSKTMDKDEALTIETPEILLRKYRFIRQIGEGANGITYLAVERVSGEKVAVKQLKKVDDFKSFDLFRREVETMKSVDIDGVPKYIDYIERSGSLDDYYLVQEYIDGQSLLEYIENLNKNGKTVSEHIVWDFALRMLSILTSLETEYQPPIIHRDIKPSNILVTQDNAFYLIDFGAVANPERKSLNSTIAGTQGYMAPEQLMGDCTVQSDYYGLGATMLHLLTGVAPYKIDNEGMKLLFEQVIDERAPKTSRRMREVLARLLAVKPEDRPKNCQELSNLVEVDDEQYRKNAYLEKHPTDCKIGKFLERHRWLRGLIALIMCYPLGPWWGLANAFVAMINLPAIVIGFFVAVTMMPHATNPTTAIAEPIFDVFSPFYLFLGYYFVAFIFNIFIYLYNANTFNNPNKEVKYNINTILWHYEVFERTDALNAVDFDIKDLKDLEGTRGCIPGRIEKVDGQDNKIVYYSFEFNREMQVGHFSFCLSDYDEKAFDDLNIEFPDVMDTYRKIIDDNAYLVGAEIMISYIVREEGLELCVEDDQFDLRTKLLRPWLIRAERLLSPVC